MKNLDKQFTALRKKVETFSGKGERAIINNHRETYKQLKNIMANVYEQYEEEGQLTYDDMTKYNRIQKLDKEMQTVITELFQGNNKLIKNTLKGIATETYNSTISTVEGVVERKLKGIVKELSVDKVINNDMAGLHWGDRVGKHRSDLIYSIKREVGQGLRQGDTYSTMTKRLKKELEVSASKAATIVRTEGHRVFAETQRESLDSISNHGVQMVKTWKSSADERVRGNKPTDKMNHVVMNGVTIPLKEDFVLPDGTTGYGPGLTNSKNDINCRCIIVIDIVMDEDKPVVESKTSEEYITVSELNKGKNQEKVGHLSEGDLKNTLGKDYKDVKKEMEEFGAGGYIHRDSKENIKYFDKLLEKHPELKWSEGELYRGAYIDNKVLESYKVGEVINQKGLSSWSSKERVSMDFATTVPSKESANSTSIIFVDKTQGTRNAMSIKNLTNAPWEDEVLYSGDSTFRINKVYEKEISSSKTISGKANSIYIEVEEVVRKK